MTFAALTGRKVLTDLFAIESAIDHIGTSRRKTICWWWRRRPPI
jgi:hypothetical protein